MGFFGGLLNKITSFSSSGWGKWGQGYTLELPVICPTACGVDESARDTRNEELTINDKLYNRV